jgi:AcrR family transcriptional regulator
VASHPAPQNNGEIRGNQRARTRKDLLSAASRLLKQGKTPDMDEVAREAMVSRATAYRYFPSIEALLVEAPLDFAVPEPAELFAHDASDDPVERVNRAESVLHQVCYGNEKQLRMMLAASMDRALQGQDPRDVPLRQNRRSGLIAAALAPARKKMSKANYEKLAAALALVFGTESMIVFKDVLGTDEDTARKVKQWAVKTLVTAALDDSAASSRRENRR